LDHCGCSDPFNVGLRNFVLSNPGCIFVAVPPIFKRQKQNGFLEHTITSLTFFFRTILAPYIYNSLQKESGGKNAQREKSALFRASMPK
jgi:hypothetical protein